MPYYLDHAASSPIRPGVLAAYAKYLGVAGNPSSVHSFGQAARQLLEEAREEIATLLRANRSEVIFTSGGTESDNLAIKGIYWHRNTSDPKRKLIVTSKLEHHAVLETIEWLVREQGAEVSFVSLNEQGEIDLAALEELLSNRSNEIALVSLMWANNEIGVVNPIKQITSIAKQHGIPVHSDGVAALGHLRIDFEESGLSALTITGHKIGSPVGIGALLVARNQKLTPLFQGGSHERGLRSGTQDAAAAKAFALSVSEAVAEIDSKATEHKKLLGRLVEGVRDIASDVKVTGEFAERIPNIVHLRFSNLLGETLMFLLDREGIAVSTGAACSAGVPEPSHVVLALVGSETEANSCIRISLGHDSTEQDIEAFLNAFPKAYEAASRANLVGKK